MEVGPVNMYYVFEVVVQSHDYVSSGGRVGTHRVSQVVVSGVDYGPGEAAIVAQQVAHEMFPRDGMPVSSRMVSRQNC